MHRTLVCLAEAFSLDGPRNLPVQAPTSCRTGRLVLLVGHNNKEVPVRLTVEPAMVGRTRVLTATGKRVPAWCSLWLLLAGQNRGSSDVSGQGYELQARCHLPTCLQ